MSKVEEQLTLLTPGSVWMSAKGTPSYVLCVTNENIPAAKQKQFPPQVVFADEEGELFSVHLDRFLEHREFHHVEYDLEQKIENLFVQEPEPESEGDDASAAGVTDVQPQQAINNQSILELEEAAALADQHKLQGSSQRGLKSVFQFEHAQGLEDPVLNSIVLANALRSFSQEPNIAESQLTNRLTFLLDAAVTLETLEETFSDSKVRASNRRGILAITAQSAGHIETIVWDQYLGTYPVYTDGGAYGVVMLAQNVSISQQQDEGDEPDASATDEIGDLMGDGAVPAQTLTQEQTPAGAFEAAVEQTFVQEQAQEPQSFADEPAPQAEQAPVVQVQPAVQVQPQVQQPNVVHVNPTPTQNGN